MEILLFKVMVSDLTKAEKVRSEEVERDLHANREISEKATEGESLSGGTVNIKSQITGAVASTIKVDRSGQHLIFKMEQSESKLGTTSIASSEGGADLEEIIVAEDARQFGLFDGLERQADLKDVILKEVCVPKVLDADKGEIAINLTKIMTEQQLEAVFEYLLEIHEYIISSPDFSTEGEKMLQTFKIFRDHLYFLLALAQKLCPNDLSDHIVWVIKGLDVANKKSISKLFYFKKIVKGMLGKAGYRINI
jgi:hypothetical protein